MKTARKKREKQDTVNSGCKIPREWRDRLHKASINISALMRAAVEAKIVELNGKGWK